VSRLLIHIGTHKTATTRLQKLFHRNRDLLAQHDVIFPQIGKEDGQHALVGVWNDLLLPAPDFDARVAWADLATQYAKGRQTVFISSEEFSRMNSRKVDMAELARLAAPFDDVVVLCTLRNQASFLQSIYQQISTSRPPADWAAFFTRMIEIRMADGLTLDFNRFYSHLLTGFARRQIRLVSYDHAIKEQGGIIGAYLRELGLPLALEDLSPIRDTEANISPEPLASFATCLLTRPASPPRKLVQLVQDAVVAKLEPGTRSSLLTRAELEEMSAVFGPMNAALSDRIKPYQPDFSVGPMLGTGKVRFRDEFGDDFWVSICRKLEGFDA
jgi:hypothetical protein